MKSISQQIHYRKGYKYQLAEILLFDTDITGYDIKTEFIELSPLGILLIKLGYAWDGASGPAIDDDTNIRPSCIHDALYQLIRMELLPPEYRELADDILEFTCIEDGMPKFRAEAWHRGVDLFAAGAADPKNKKEVFVSP
jgi:hypothetical protein